MSNPSSDSFLYDLAYVPDRANTMPQHDADVPITDKTFFLVQA